MNIYLIVDYQTHIPEVAKLTASKLETEGQPGSGPWGLSSTGPVSWGGKPLQLAEIPCASAVPA
jgi:hypothetical protein